jgi:type IV pilus assembly protein PilF
MMTTIRNRAGHRRQPGWRLALLLPGLLACGALPVALTGCAGGSRASIAGAPAELATARDDTPERKRARVRLQLAASYYGAGNYTVALDEIKQVIRTDPGFPDAYNLAGLIYQALEQPELAEPHFRHAVALNPRDGSSLQNLGWLQCQQKQYAPANQSFTQALAAPGYPDRAKTLLTQGICQARAGNTAQAVETLKRAWELDRSHPVTAYNLAQLLFNERRYDDARLYIRSLNNGHLANAQSLWLGVKVERALNNRAAMQQLGEQLQRRFGDSHEALSYQRSAFDE